MFEPKDYLLAFANLNYTSKDNNVYKRLDTPAAFIKTYSWPVYDVFKEAIIEEQDYGLYEEVLSDCEHVVTHSNGNIRSNFTKLLSNTGTNFINATSLRSDPNIQEGESLSNLAKISIGFIIINPLLEGENRLKLLALDLHIRGKKDRQYKVRFLEEAYIQLTQERLLLAYGKRLPSKDPPKSWSSVKEDGMIKSRVVPSVGSSSSCKANNILQGTAWRINDKIINNIKIGGRLGQEDQFKLRQSLYNLYAIEKKRLDDTYFSKNINPPGDEYGAYKELKTQYEEARDSLKGRDTSFIGLLGVIKRFGDSDRFYFKYTNDFRGRIYPTSIYMSPQGSDLEKAVIEFAVPVQVTPRVRYWQEWNLASLIVESNTIDPAIDLSLDKLLPDERVAWVKNNWGSLEHIARDPINNTKWHAWEKPYCALAQLMEMVFTPTESRQPIAIDATCSGLQFLAAMGADAQVGKAVNLTKSNQREDVYLYVADIIKAKLSEDPFWGNSKFTMNIWRKLVKRCVMVFGYAGTRFGMGEIVYADGKDLLKKKFPKDSDISNFSKKNGIELGNLIYDSLSEILPKPEAIMKFVTIATARLLTKRIEDGCDSKDSLALSWVAPSGFRVNQYIEKYLTEQERFSFGTPVLIHEMRGGKIHNSSSQRSARLSLVLNRGISFDKKKMSTSISPNFVHSYDAALVVKTCIAMNNTKRLEQASFCHDSFGVAADRMDELNEEVRRQFISMFSTGINTIESFAVENGITRDTFKLSPKEEYKIKASGNVIKDKQAELYSIYDEAMKQGTLDVTEVQYNPFFFS